MVCPQCQNADTQVTDSRDGPECIRRRRECLNCKCRFTTYERLELPSILILKKSGDKEKFDSEKIRRGVKISCKNRPVTSAMIDDLVSTVAKRVYFNGKEELSSSEVGRYVQEELQRLDPIAYLRFTSVYRSFADIGQFEQEIQNIH